MASLPAWVQESFEVGLLGPRAPESHLEHAAEFLALVRRFSPANRVGDLSSASLVDLGTGGGFPGLFLASEQVFAECVLIEGRVRRSEFLAGWVVQLGLEGFTGVVCDRAEILGRGSLREHFDVATARSFAKPSVTAECGSALLRVGGVLIVSDPPAFDGVDETRWNSEGLMLLGLSVKYQQVAPFAFTVLEKISPLPPEFPRRQGVLERRPLF